MFYSLLLICVIIAVYWWYLHTGEEPPLLPGAIPILGHVHKLLGNSQQLWKYIESSTIICIKTGGTNLLFIGPHRVYVTVDPDDSMIIVNNCLKKSYIYNYAKRWIGDGLVIADVHLWKNHRRLLNPTFKTQVLNGYIEMFNQQSRLLVQTLSTHVGKGLFDQSPILSESALNTICLTSLGVDVKESQLTKNYTTTMENIFNLYIERYQKFWLHPNLIWNLSSLKKKEEQYTKILENITDTIIEKRRSTFKETYIPSYEGDGHFKSFLDLLLEIELLENSPFTKSHMRNHVDNIIIAGHHTTSFTLTCALMFIGSHSSVQDRLLAELLVVFGDSDRNVDKEDLPRLVYTEAVLKETMRLYPAIPVIGRVLDSDIKLENYTLKAGSDCFVWLNGIHRHPIWGHDAELFRPERWLDSNRLPSNPNAFFAFSVGRRACMGKSYAMMLMKITLVYILRHYCVYRESRKFEAKLDVMLKTVSGHEISLERRNT